jgi:hypothetical protein
MGTILASALISKARVLLQDPGAVRWTDGELLGWLNDGQRAAVVEDPMVNTKIVAIPLVAGSKQALPVDGVKLVGVYRNMGAGGTTPGNSVRKIDRMQLDALVPGWNAMTATNVVQHFILGPTPDVFFVYPPSTGSWQVEAEYCALPADVPAVGSPITLDDVWANALLEYMLYRAYGKDQEFIGNAEQSLLHFKAFRVALGARETA